MDIEKTLDEAAAYFKNKILEGDYEVVEYIPQTVKIQIDGAYNFVLWRANTPELNFEVHLSYLDLSIIGGRIKFDTPEERQRGWSVASSRVAEKRTAEEQAARRAQYEDLKKEFGE